MAQFASDHSRKDGQGLVRNSLPRRCAGLHNRRPLNLRQRRRVLIRTHMQVPHQKLSGEGNGESITRGQPLSFGIFGAVGLERAARSFEVER
jgi:hypothetical protein